jgi:hypothetical protein
MKLGVLIAGVIVLLAAVLSAIFKLFGASPGKATRAVHWVIGLCGVALIVWGLAAPWLPLGSQSHVAEVVSTVDATVPAVNAIPPAHPDLLLMASSSFAGCQAPIEPSDVPDGSTATRAQMLAGQQAMKSYDAADTAYVTCLDSASDHLVDQYREVASRTDLGAVSALDIKLHNAAVDHAQAVVERYNQQLRVYKAKHNIDQSPLPAAR